MSVKGVKIRGKNHIIKHNGMSGYRTFCGKTASFGHQVYQFKMEEVTCPDCIRVKGQEPGV